MTTFSTLQRLLVGLAVLGLLLAPVARPVMAETMNMSAVEGTVEMANGGMAMSEDMPCCPDTAPASDCGTACPLMALCFAGALQNLPVEIVLLTPWTLSRVVVPGNDAGLASLAQGPPPRPPKL